MPLSFGFGKGSVFPKGQRTPAALLDLSSISGIAAAHSLRKLYPAYAGSSIRVRRSSDSTEQDIGFDASGLLDTASLLTFCGADSGFVTLWYDQSGAGKHQRMATTTEQPRIVNAGVVEKTAAGMPRISTAHAVSSMAGDLTISSGSFTINLVYSWHGGNRAINGSNNWLMGAYGGGGSGYQIYMGSGFIAGGSAATTGRIITHTGVFASGTGATNYVTGTSVGTSATFGYPGRVCLSRGLGVAGYGETASCYYYELICTTVALSTTDRETIELNQKTYFSAT